MGNHPSPVFRGALRYGLRAPRTLENGNPRRDNDFRPGDFPEVIHPCKDRNTNLISSTDNYAAEGAPAFLVTSYKALQTINQSTLTPGYADGALVGTSNITLSWSDLATAGNYRVYLSTSLGKIELAQPGDATEIGTTYGTSLPVKTALLPNTTYYWKLILEGAASSTSSPEWSFHTSDFTVSEGAVAMAGPIDSAPLTHDLRVNAPDGRNWSVSTTTPWLQATGSGPGSGIITLTSNPAGLVEGTVNGSVTLSIGTETLIIPVSFQSFSYHVRRIAGDGDRGFAHLLVATGPTETYSTATPAFLIKIDLATHKVVDVIDLGISLSYYDATSLMIHPQDDRVYFYNGTAGKITGYNRSKYALETSLATASLAGLPAGSWNGAMVPAGPGRMVLNYGSSNLSVYSTSTGALLSTLANPNAYFNFTSLFAAPGGKRIYGALDYYYGFPASFDVSDAGIITAGPVAITGGPDAGYTITFGITADGQKVYYQGAYYDKDLNLLGKPLPIGRLQLPVGDGSRLLMNGDRGYYFATADGTATSPGFSYGGAYNIAYDPTGARFLYAGSGNQPFWAEALTTASGAVPQIPGSLWATYGQSTWMPDLSRPGVLTTTHLKDVASNPYSSSQSVLAVTPTVAGTLSFDWRTVTTGGETLSLSVNDTSRSSVTGTNDWQPRLISVAAGDRVAVNYQIAYTASDKNSLAELRNITFTPAAGAATVAAGISPTVDRDGDGFTDLMETALGTDPDSAVSRPVAGLVTNATTASFVYERPASSNYQYTVQVSQDLVNWQDLPAENASVAAVAATIPGGATRQRVTMPLTAAGPKGFTRLKVVETATR
ncbi:MAG: hypothetical protein JWO82_3065 [Akkermansiaceae bacterium]|nr:hypothetical protein [Akkermansiaceae bacterium]